MTRPTRYCTKCGEYVTEKDVTSDGDHWRIELVHISADGATIYRGHKAIKGGKNG